MLRKAVQGMRSVFCDFSKNTKIIKEKVKLCGEKLKSVAVWTQENSEDNSRNIFELIFFVDAANPGRRVILEFSAGKIEYTTHALAVDNA